MALPHRDNSNVNVGNKARKLNKICSGNLLLFSPESIVEHFLASRLDDKVSIFS